MYFVLRFSLREEMEEKQTARGAHLLHKEQLRAFVFFFVCVCVVFFLGEMRILITTSKHTTVM